MADTATDPKTIPPAVFEKWAGGKKWSLPCFSGIEEELWPPVPSPEPGVLYWVGHFKKKKKKKKKLKKKKSLNVFDLLWSADLAAEAPETEGIDIGPTLALAPNHLVTRAQNLVKNRLTDSMELSYRLYMELGGMCWLLKDDENRAKSR